MYIPTVDGNNNGKAKGNLLGIVYTKIFIEGEGEQEGYWSQLGSGSRLYDNNNGDKNTYETMKTPGLCEGLSDDFVRITFWDALAESAEPQAKKVRVRGQ